MFDLLLGKRYYLALGLGPYNGLKFTRKNSCPSPRTSESTWMDFCGRLVVVSVVDVVDNVVSVVGVVDVVVSVVGMVEVVVSVVGMVDVVVSVVVFVVGVVDVDLVTSDDAVEVGLVGQMKKLAGNVSLSETNRIIITRLLTFILFGMLFEHPLS